jgi:hypothetical protein
MSSRPFPAVYIEIVLCSVLPQQGQRRDERHGERSDEKQQGKEEAEGRVE